ncbi:hypothetical protein BLOT_010742 [Blomia tropicalis]|nr:hypothetical protein BLOT_010742 [Blomia tropicalis]
MSLWLRCFNFNKLHDEQSKMNVILLGKVSQYSWYKNSLVFTNSRHGTARHDTARHDTTRHDTTRHDTTRHDTTRHDTTRHDTTRHDTTRHDMFHFMLHRF